jgi:purine-nucleoside phosphorylase
VKQKALAALAFIRQKTRIRPNIGVILGTGLGQLAQAVRSPRTIPYDTIPHFPVATTESHAGMLLFGNIKGKKVVLMQGRFHYYEGYSAREITLPVMVMKLLGVKTIIISNASGGLNPNFTRGDLMVITDHINFIPDNPLRGHIDHKLGQRFTDMYNCYDNKLVDLAEQSARHLRLPLHRGVYAALPGPNLETKAEYRYLRSIGADAVGMSTAPEVIMARFLKMRVLGLSIITDLGIADALKPIGATQIITTARKAEPNLTRLVAHIINSL